MPPPERPAFFGFGIFLQSVEKKLITAEGAKKSRKVREEKQQRSKAKS